MDTRQKLLQARQLEKTYQEKHKKHRLGQKEPQVDFIKGLKNLGIDSMTDYHKLVKTDGYKGRNIEVRQVVSTPLQMAKDAVADNKDIVMWEISKNIRVYTGSLDVAEKTLNVDFCKKEGIELIPIGIKNNGWMSIAGNPSIQFALKRPIDTSSFKNIGLQIIADSLKEQFNLDIVIDGNDALVGNQKIFASVISEFGDYGLVAFGMSMRTDRELCKKVFKKPALKIPTGIEEIVGHKIDAMTLIENVISKFASVTGNTFEYEIKK